MPVCPKCLTPAAIFGLDGTRVGYGRAVSENTSEGLGVDSGCLTNIDKPRYQELVSEILAVKAASSGLIPRSIHAFVDMGAFEISVAL